MPITINVGGVLQTMNNVFTNASGVLRGQNAVIADDSGVLREIHSNIPRTLTWTADTSKDDAAKINSVSEDGMTVTFTASNIQWAVAGTAAVCSNYIRLPAGVKITAEFSDVVSIGKNKHYGLMAMKSGVLVGSEVNNGVCSLDIAEAGLYRLVLRAHGVTGSQSGVSYYSCKVTVKITITN